jgi:uncharacterized membrane protein YiaA
VEDFPSLEIEVELDEVTEELVLCLACAILTMENIAQMAIANPMTMLCVLVFLIFIALIFVSQFWQVTCLPFNWLCCFEFS